MKSGDPALPEEAGGGMILKICGITNQEDASAAAGGPPPSVSISTAAARATWRRARRRDHDAPAYGASACSSTKRGSRRRNRPIGRWMSRNCTAARRRRITRIAGRMESRARRRSLRPFAAVRLPGGSSAAGWPASGEVSLAAGCAAPKPLFSRRLDARTRRGCGAGHPWGVDAAPASKARREERHRKMNEFLQGQGGARPMTPQPDPAAISAIRGVMCRGPHGAHRGARASLPGRARGRAFQSELADCCGPMRAVPRRSISPNGSVKPWAARASGSSAKTAAHRRAQDQQCLARRWWRGAWANAASWPRPARPARRGQPPRLCALGFECVVYMARRNAPPAPQRFRMRLLGARVVGSPAAAARSRTLSAKPCATGLERRRHVLSAGLGARRASLPHDGARFPEDHR